MTDAAARAAREEAGILIAPGDPRVVGVMHRRCATGAATDERIDFFLTARRWAGRIVDAARHTCDALAWHPIDELPVTTIPDARRALANPRDGRWFDRFGWA